MKKKADTLNEDDLDGVVGGRYMLKDIALYGQTQPEGTVVNNPPGGDKRVTEGGVSAPYANGKLELSSPVPGLTKAFSGEKKS